jgi:hypothetical protein
MANTATAWGVRGDDHVKRRLCRGPETRTARSARPERSGRHGFAEFAVDGFSINEQSIHWFAVVGTPASHRRAGWSESGTRQRCVGRADGLRRSDGLGRADGLGGAYRFQRPEFERPDDRKWGHGYSPAGFWRVEFRFPREIVRIPGEVH